MSNLQKKHVLIYGDAFVDYIAKDTTNSEFQTFLGGATVNVAAGLSRLGARSAFITVTGDDETSEFVRSELLKESVDLSFAKHEDSKRVSGVYIHLTDTNERIFYRYIDETPDIQVESDDLSKDAFRGASILHICSGTMFNQTALKTTREAVRLAKGNDVILSIDANIRPLRWESEKVCRETIVSFFADADIVKLTEEELFFLTETDSVEAGIAQLDSFQIPVLLITMGDKGTFTVINGVSEHVRVEPVQAIDTTGAGDAFIAGVLRQIHFQGIPKTHKDWVEVVEFGNRLGSLCVTKPGALSAMPFLEEI